MAVNDDIKNASIRRSVQLEGLKKSEARKARRLLNRVILPDIAAKIADRLSKIDGGVVLSKRETQRLKALEKEVATLSTALSKEVRKLITADYESLALNEQRFQTGTINNAINASYSFTTIAPELIVSTAITRPFAGNNLDQWFDRLADATQKNVVQAIQLGVAEGESVAQVTRRLRGTRRANFKDGVFETTRRQAEAVARTGIQQIVNQTRQQLFEANSDIISGVQWVATLDSRTTLICAGLDGKVFALDKGPRPPIHVNCRSAVVPVLKGANSFGGIIPSSTRSSVNGQVPASITYGVWLKKQSVATQEMVLGVDKAKLFRDGGLSIDSFTDSKLRVLTLDDLEKLEPKAFARAGL